MDLSTISIENFINNACFLCLFITMLCYWVQISSTNLTLSIPLPLQKNFFWKQLNPGFLGMICSNLLLFFSLILRWKSSHHFPLSNFYESLIFLCWSLTFIHLIFEVITKNDWVGSIIAPTALFVNAFASFYLPVQLQKIGPLIPALKSNWLMMHVTVMLLSYAALISGSLLAIAFLFIHSFLNFQTSSEQNRLRNNVSIAESLNDAYLPLLEDATDITSFSSETTSINTIDEVKQLQSNSFVKQSDQILDNLDNFSYRIIGLGFPLLTVGILSGAVWANEAWGSYWSWDPKETWALITWLIFAIYLHTRLIRQWSGFKSSVIASLGFIVVWICYLGVNLLGKGLHSYGWFA
uniref:Cytochrome c biogenesis protein CcsA n=1 Tax=Lambia antarctica TaxID=101717 RepID=A0A1L2EDW9_9CHLO|nr:cytochrome c biogenesis protein CcsA [Lambia antarctica]ANN39070.1 cytochrome c biogenesis protein CcsA [Lambia antarctica]